MTRTQKPTFPFDFVVLWVRPIYRANLSCMFCQEPAEYHHYHYVGIDKIMSEGMDAAWRNAIKRQMNGDYNAEYFQPVCLECCIHFAAIQLGKRRPIQHFLNVASMMQKQNGTEISLAIIAKVKSWNDEGDLWAMNAPNTSIEDVVKHIKTAKDRS